MTGQNFLKHILGAIDRIESYTENCSEVSFMNNFLIQDAVMRNLEIIGEASKKISSQTRSKAPSIPWKEIAGMRDKLIHVILVFDLLSVWSVVEQDLPELKSRLEKLIKHD